MAVPPPPFPALIGNGGGERRWPWPARLIAPSATDGEIFPRACSCRHAVLSFGMIVKGDEGLKLASSGQGMLAGGAQWCRGYCRGHDILAPIGQNGSGDNGHGLAFHHPAAGRPAMLTIGAR